MQIEEVHALEGSIAVGLGMGDALEEAIAAAVVIEAIALGKAREGRI